MKELVIDPMEGPNTDFHTQYESFSYMGNRLGEKLKQRLDGCII